MVLYHTHQPHCRMDPGEASFTASSIRTTSLTFFVRPPSFEIWKDPIMMACNAIAAALSLEGRIAQEAPFRRSTGDMDIFTGCSRASIRSVPTYVQCIDMIP